ncbi:hypothetical protein O3M35_002557 [Rhynocoris fuscipes]|uniref:Uncharacterized protein n=1 Tax=Rhynocoris fuscipes TaxID=488301 RepID=A0AAW1CKR3_9HEMI
MNTSNKFFDNDDNHSQDSFSPTLVQSSETQVFFQILVLVGQCFARNNWRPLNFNQILSYVTDHMQELAIMDDFCKKRLILSSLEFGKVYGIINQHLNLYRFNVSKIGPPSRRKGPREVNEL